MKEAESLDIKMHTLADKGHPRAAELREKADALVSAIEQSASAKKILGAWARARRLWCDCTGEPLI